MNQVVALGELLIDFISVGVNKTQDFPFPPKISAVEYPILASQPGGAPANFLSALQCYGTQTGMIAKVGDDAFGRLLIRTMTDKGIDTQGIIKDPSVFTTLAFVTLDDEGNREFSFARKPGADQFLRSEEINFDLIDEASVFHFGSLSLTGEPIRTATHRALAHAKTRNSMISFDPNLRVPLWNELDIARAQIEWGFYQADIVKISDNEATFLWDVSPEETAKRLHEQFDVSLVFVTLGPKGCYFSNKNVTGWVPSPKPEKVVDTTGAGDIFSGSAMNRFLALEKKPDELNQQDLESIVSFACCAASISTQSHGGIDAVPPLEYVLDRCGASSV